MIKSSVIDEILDNNFVDAYQNYSPSPNKDVELKTYEEFQKMLNSQQREKFIELMNLISLAEAYRERERFKFAFKKGIRLGIELSD